MAEKQHLEYLSHDGKTRIHAVRWIPEGEIKAVVQISHGMVEFIERYEEFAAYLSGRGILVTGHDHLGHGYSVGTHEDYGYFSEKNGNAVLIGDIHRLRRMTQKKYPEVPYFLLGHSMGSFLARQYLCQHGEGLWGAVIMGTGYKSREVVRMGMRVCKALAAVKGWHYRSRVVDATAFGGFNRHLRHPRTDRDWLTKEESIVDAYVADERCQFMFTLNGYYNMFLNIYKLSFPDFLKQMPKDLPVLFVSGAEDPVGGYGTGVEKAVKDFQMAGMKKTECRLYPGDRHEILNERDREEIYEELYEWFLRRSKSNKRR